MGLLWASSISSEHGDSRNQLCGGTGSFDIRVVDPVQLLRRGCMGERPMRQFLCAARYKRLTWYLHGELLCKVGMKDLSREFKRGVVVARHALWL